jgi:hypothetical protein
MAGERHVLKSGWLHSSAIETAKCCITYPACTTESIMSSPGCRDLAHNSSGSGLATSLHKRRKYGGQLALGRDLFTKQPSRQAYAVSGPAPLKFVVVHTGDNKSKHVEHEQLRPLTVLLVCAPSYFHTGCTPIQHNSLRYGAHSVHGKSCCETLVQEAANWLQQLTYSAELICY